MRFPFVGVVVESDHCCCYMVLALGLGLHYTVGIEHPPLSVDISKTILDT